MHEGPEYLEEGSGGCYTIITLRNHETLLLSCSMQSRQKYRFLVQSAPKRCSYYFDPCIHQDQEQGQARLRDLPHGVGGPCGLRAARRALHGSCGGAPRSQKLPHHSRPRKKPNRVRPATHQLQTPWLRLKQCRGLSVPLWFGGELAYPQII